jgi:hypothetical protein
MNFFKHLSKALNYIVYLTCITLAAITLTVLFISPANAAFVSGNTLLEDCSAPNGTQKRDFCLMYIAGAMDAYQDDKICIPAGITLGQATDMVSITLKAMPQERHAVPGDVYVLLTFAKLYPCPKKAPSQGQPSGSRVQPI